MIPWESLAVHTKLQRWVLRENTQPELWVRGHQPASWCEREGGQREAVG